VADLLPRDCIVSSEGAATMDIGRTILDNYLPRRWVAGQGAGRGCQGVGRAVGHGGREGSGALVGGWVSGSVGQWVGGLARVWVGVGACRCGS
jgi:hypothetical protein